MISGDPAEHVEHVLQKKLQLLMHYSCFSGWLSYTIAQAVFELIHTLLAVQMLDESLCKSEGQAKYNPTSSDIGQLLI